MLPKRNRLLRKEILAMRDKPLIFQGQYFGLIYIAETESKFGVIVSAKIAKSAVVRNQIKRNLFRAIETQELRPGWYLFLAKKAAANATEEEIKAELANLRLRMEKRK